MCILDIFFGLVWTDGMLSNQKLQNNVKIGQCIKKHIFACSASNKSETCMTELFCNLL